MFFKSSATLLSEKPALREAIVACDNLLGTATLEGVLTESMVVQRLEHLNSAQVRLALKGLAAKGVVSATNVTACSDCATINERLALECSQCQSVLADGLPDILYDLSATADRIPSKGASDPAPKPTPEIGIIVALPLEFAALKLVLDLQATWIERGGTTPRRYQYGNIRADDGGSHSVVAALLSTTGNNSASGRATLLLTQFPTVRDVIMCGIAGGIRTKETDLRLGDVVVCDKFGIVQYDFGKNHDDGFEMRAPPRPPSARILDALGHVLSANLLNERPWEGFLESRPDLPWTVRPPDDAGAQPGARVEYPVDVQRRAGMPKLISGTIGSANQVLRNEALHPALIANGVVAVEMEGSGIADATWNEQTGYMVVRGIADFADCQKGDVWHGYSALAAAAVLRAILQSVPSTEVPR